MGPWLHQICRRNVKVIEIKPIKKFAGCHYLPVQLPCCVFQTPSLEILELTNNIPYNLPTFTDNHAGIHLPNLRKLCISLSSESCCASFSKIISSCPSLEDLFFIVRERSGMNLAWPHYPSKSNFYISNQSLKQLYFDYYPYDYDKVVINTPNLVKFTIIYFDVSKILFTTTPLALCEAILLLSGTAQIDKIPLPAALTEYVFKGISMVRSLALGSHKPLDCTMRIVGAFLESCPLVEAFTLDISNCSNNETNWMPPSVLANVSPYLKRMHIYLCLMKAGSISYDNLLLLVEYFLTSIQTMDQLTLKITQSWSDDQCTMEKQLCKHLYKFSRCQIVFSGIYFKATVPNGHIIERELVLED